MSNEMQNARDMEAKIAELLDGEQSEGPSSRAGVPDVTTDELVVECKHRKEYPKWLLEAVTQPMKYLENSSNRLPATVLHRKYHDHSTDMVVMPLYHFKNLLNGGEDD